MRQCVSKLRIGNLALSGMLAFALIQCPALAQQPRLLGVETIDEALPVFDGRQVRLPTEDDDFPPLRALLSRYRYWAQDGHLDVVAQLDDENPQGELRVRLLGEDGQALSSFEISPLPGARFVFYPAIPDALANGGHGEIQIAWVRDGNTVAELNERFRVEVFDEPVERSGLIPLTVPNGPGVRQDNVPATVGVPFPRGALEDIANLRLVDEAGSEVPLQVMETARWSRFGSVKWALCDFTVDLDGGPRELFLEYGPDVSRAERPAISVTQTDGFPVVEAGRLRFDGGLWFDAEGDGNFVQVLDEQALSGAFIEHEDGRLYRAPVADRYEVEEHGPQKVVLRREGWYQEEDGDRAFCKHVTRYVIHRDSPLFRVFHTWIFTGDGNRDHIRNMGWEFALAEGFEQRGFLTAFGEEGSWEDADYLLQWDYDHFDLVSGAQADERSEARAPGAAAARGDGVNLYFGAKDFWQNYPSELEFRDGSLWFHNWPRHNRPAGHTFAKELITERGEPAVSSSAARYAHEHPERLTLSEWRLNAVQSRHAHEGEALDFRIPEEYAEDPIWVTANDSRPQGSPEWFKGEPESINAQGVARSEEMWIYLAPEDSDAANAARVLEGLNEATVRATVDTRWVAQSLAFHEMHPQDWEMFPEEERIYELVALSPARANERLGIYGMWIYGDIPAWGLNLPDKRPDLYRALRKRHLKWPYPWMPFARSGDPRLFRSADAATRHLVDKGYCHYVSDDVVRNLGPARGPTRRIGVWDRGLIPWACRGGTRARGYEQRVDFLLDAWYLTGFARAKDTVAAVMDMFKPSPGEDFQIGPNWGRGTNALFKTSLQLYEESFDPWFLVVAHGISQGHMHGPSRENPDRLYGGRIWDTGDREFMRYTGCEAFEDFYLNQHVERSATIERGSFNRRHPMYPAKAFAWKLTGDEFYLRRTVHAIDNCLANVRDAEEPWYMQGVWQSNSAGRGYTFFTPSHLRWFPHSLWAVADAGYRPAPLYSTFAPFLPEQELDGYMYRLELAFRKEAGAPLPVTLRAAGDGYIPVRPGETHTADYTLTGPDGEVAKGAWQMTERSDVEVPADAPEGVYRLELLFPQRRSGRFDLGATPLGTPEVILLAPGEPTPNVEWRSLWFMVPEGVTEFRVEQCGPETEILDSDGKTVWGAADHDAGQAPERAPVRVAPEHAGRLWRVARPGHFRLDDRIPQAFSVCPTRWFNPDAVED